MYCCYFKTGFASLNYYPNVLKYTAGLLNQEVEVKMKGVQAGSASLLPENVEGKIDLTVVKDTLVRLQPFNDDYVLEDARQHYYTSHSVLGPYAIIPRETGIWERLSAADAPMQTLVVDTAAA